MGDVVTFFLTRMGLSCRRSCLYSAVLVSDVFVKSIVRLPNISMFVVALYLPHLTSACGAGAPLFPPCPFTSSSFPPFTFLFLSLALPIFFLWPSLPFLPE